MRHHLLWLSCSLALAVSGCAGTTTAATGPQSSPTTHVAPRTLPAGIGSGAADGVFPRTVRHFEGSTQLKVAPKKVVVVSTGQADSLLTLGITPAGSTRGDGADLIPKYLIDAYPQQRAALAKVGDVGSRLAPSIEAIARIAPDLILMNVAGKDSKALYANLSKLAPTVASRGTGLYWKQDFLLVADAVGETEKAQQLLDQFQTDAAALGNSLSPRPTVSFLRKNGNRLRVYGVPSFTGSVADDAGLPRPKDQQFNETSQDISSEQLDRADADWLFYGVQKGDAEKTMSANPLWPALNAVTTQHAIPVDDDVFYLNTGRKILTTLQKTLKP
ncbi:ABC transporter substrate-binding protein [Kribbella kalugense]|uniref:Iron complex transport system substrate-binding protein n=1 Tax=Kribbella kalugense TaxID=2512221 RepID=A0A4R7ZWA2_9ACTN|nr:iron-siderophore ABC transporter substrate-binding protein [Kribbella kalugense]TDW21956.1 iron complex transport system substrate-binding protein [Kribbella kalugense]